MRTNIFIILTVGSLLLQQLNAQQHIGIGTSSPSEKLHVAGNIKADTIKPHILRISSGAGEGKVLMSDASGNATWKNGNSNAPGNVGFGVWGDCAANGNIAEYNPVIDSDGSLFDLFGWSVSISGDYAIVGAKDDDPASDQFSRNGSATIYHYNGAIWEAMQKLTDSASERSDFFGQSVSISNNFAIVGIPGDDTAQGSVNIYELSAGSWVLTQKLIAANGDLLDNFGISVCISGNRIIVGAYSDDIGANANQGSANIYQYNGNRWVLMQKITDILGAAGDNFGESVSISGNFAIVGAPNDDAGANVDQGSVSIFQYDGSNWVLLQRITDVNGEATDNFGNSVSISGNNAIVGAYLDDVGANGFQGSASIYELKNGSWLLMQKLTDGGGSANDNFGTSVSISGNYALVGSSGGTFGANQGSASIYLRIGNGWGKLQHVTDPMANPTDAFGHSAAIDSGTKRFLISAVNYSLGSGKAIFGKVN
jgi:hypothetical protein